MRTTGVFTAYILVVVCEVFAAPSDPGTAAGEKAGEAVPQLVLGQPPKAVRGICASGKPLLAGDGRQVVLVSIFRGEEWIFDGRHVDRWKLELPTGAGRLLAPVAFSSRDGMLVLFAFRPPRLVLYENGRLVDEIAVEGFPPALAIRRGEILVGLIPPLRDAEDIGKPFVYLRSYDPGMQRWDDLLTVKLPDWVPEENRSLKEEARQRAAAKGSKHFVMGHSEQRRWASGLVAVRRDRKLWFVNRYDGAVTLLSRSGSTLWKGQVPDVVRSGFSAEEKVRFEAALADHPLGVRAQGLARFRPQILSVTAHDDDLAVLFRSGSTQTIRLAVLDDQTNRWNLWALPDGLAPSTIAVMGDTLWLARPCRTVEWSELIGRRQEMRDGGSVAPASPAPGAGTP
ncbi:MAG: hypothetical protein GXP47_14030 [Acidobacteria bacterium]|nr:hypothetical protein [Acidobacteriota bacterium]